MARTRSNPPCGVRLAVVNRTRCRLPSLQLLNRAAGLALSPLVSKAGKRPLAATLVCVGQRRMRQLNARFTGRSELTDVLSFAEGEVDPDEGVYRVGDVIICSAAARKAARGRGVSIKDELMLYALHGWLHLAGYRDGNSVQKDRMVAAERRIMKALGLRRAD
jgi:probable rRNA maturation factor